MRKSSFFILFMLIFLSLKNDELILIKEFEVEIKEPSGICYDKEDNAYYIVSDKGGIYKVNSDFKILAQRNFKGADFEGISVQKNLLYVVDESSSKVILFNKKNFKKLKTINLKLKVNPNNGIEGITYIPTKKQYVVVTEKNPIKLIFYNEQFIKLKQVMLSKCSDVSDIVYHQDHLYLLSDEDQKIVKLDTNLTAVKQYSIPVYNPEGICFNKNKMIITSDKKEKVYFFNSI